MIRKSIFGVFLITVILLFVSDSLSISFSEKENPIEQKNVQPTLIDPNFKIDILATGLNFPTKMTFIDDETILVAQKNDGKIMVIKNFEFQEEPALDLNVEGERERGLVGLTSVNYQNSNLVFVYYTESIKDEDTYVVDTPHTENKNNGNKLVRYTWNGKSLVDPTLILHPISHSGTFHNGGAMTILEDQLFLMVGDNQELGFLTNDQRSRILDRGVIFRINFDGEPYPNNPFSEPELSKYYSYGIRNGYGLTVDPITNNIWDTENGPAEYDEINLVFPGFNSGWSKIMGPKGDGFFSAKISDLTTLENSKYSEPEFSWKDTVGLTEIEFLKSKKFGNSFENDVFVGDVNGNLYHFELNENRDGLEFTDSVLHDKIAQTHDEVSSILFGKNLGAITDIDTGPDGYLYLISLVWGDVPGWDKFSGNLANPEIVKAGMMNGVLFRIIPTFQVSELDEITSPKKQIESGINPKEIKCKENFELVFKKTNNMPACVKPLTAIRLLELGWAIN